VTQASTRPTALASCHAQPTAGTLAVSRSVPRRNGSIPTVLLVHGAFADGSMWAGVITELQAAGIDVIAVASPLRGLMSDAAYVARAVAEIDGPVLLAGHDYGGAVITAAGSAAGNLTGLVYVAAFALDEGESALDITGRFPASQLMPALRPATFPCVDGDPAVELYIDRGCSPPTCPAGRPRPRPPRSDPSPPPRSRRNRPWPRGRRHPAGTSSPPPTS